MFYGLSNSWFSTTLYFPLFEELITCCAKMDNDFVLILDNVIFMSVGVYL